MTIPIEVPQYVADETTARWPSIGRGGCPRLPANCVRFANGTASYRLPSYPHDGLVVAVEADERRLVIKGSPDPDSRNQVHVMSALADLEVGPAILESFSTETGHWMIMQRITPGEPLRNLGASMASPERLATVLRSLVDQPAPSTTLPYVGDWLQDRLEDDSLSDLAPGRSVASQADRANALSVLAELTADCPWLLCHGDTSPGNILTGEKDALFLIDPRGMQGEVAYDVAVLGLKSAMKVPAGTRVADLASAVGIDVARARAWASMAVTARV